jgi:hypothetical protein
MPNTELERTDPFEINSPEPDETGLSTTDAAPIIGTGGLPVPQDDIRHLCRHIFADGRRCGSPALKTHNFCYYHYIHRSHHCHGYRHWRNKQRNGAEDRLELFDGLDNPTSIQLAITTVASRIAAGSIHPRAARSLLYALQLAANNVRNIKTTENSTVAPDIVEDNTWGHLAQLEPSRTEPETLESRLKAPHRKRKDIQPEPKPKQIADPESKPFTGYYPDYEIPEELEETVRFIEGLDESDPLFDPARKTSLY